MPLTECVDCGVIINPHLKSPSKTHCNVCYDEKSRQLYLVPKNGIDPNSEMNSDYWTETEDLTPEVLSELICDGLDDYRE